MNEPKTIDEIAVWLKSLQRTRLNYSSNKEYMQSVENGFNNAVIKLREQVFGKQDAS